MIRNSVGMDIATVSVDDVGQGWSIRSNSRGHLRNHLLVLEVQINTQSLELIGIDLFKALAGDSQPVVWRQRLWGDGRRVIGFAPNRNIPTMQMQSRSNSLGIQMLNTAYDSNLIGSYSEPTDDGLVYLKDEHAVCIDSVTGQVRWRRGDLTPGGSVFASDGKAWVIGKDELTISEFSLLDGRELLGREVEPFGMVFGFDQGVAVGVSSTGDQHVLVGTDLASGEAAWRIEVPQSARAELLDDDGLALLEPDGTFRVIDMATGEALLSTAIGAQQDVASIQWLEDAFGYLLLVNRNSMALRQNSRLMEDVTLMAVMQQPLVDGEIYAFDFSGRPTWPGPVEVEQYSVLGQDLGQIPVIVLARNYQTREQGVATMYMDIVLVDRRDGRLLWDETAITGSIRNTTWNITFDPETGATTVAGAKRFTIRPSEEPLPPAPAALTGSRASGAQRRPPSARRIFNGIGRALVQ
ncbi:MAG: PQQ-binding-like beta-propeller repeat protein [Pirellulaceae bacterium]